jgi:hypothetical protein
MFFGHNFSEKPKRRKVMKKKYSTAIFVLILALISFTSGCDKGTAFDITKDAQPMKISGDVGTWATTTSFATTRDSHTSVAYNGYMYVIGGRYSSALNDVQYAPINANGTIGTWNTTTSFTTARLEHTSVVHNGYLYVIGGNNGVGGVLNNVQYASINANGTIGTWNSTTSFTTGRAGHTSVVQNGYLYVIGGIDGGAVYLNDVQYAPINANGTIGTWNTTTSFTTGRYAHTSAVYNGYLFVIGGYDGTALYRNDVQYAPINANGTTGTWNSTTSFTTGRYAHTSVVNSNYLYVIGGLGGGNLNDVQYSSINANGTIGTWTTTTPFTTARYEHTSVVYNGYIYVLGGYVSTGVGNLNEVQYATIGR